MSLKGKNGIEMIQQGQIDFYCPLKFETSKNYDELCSIINDTLNQTIADHLGEAHSNLRDVFDSIQDDIYSKYQIKLSFKPDEKKRIQGRRKHNKKHSPAANNGTSLVVSTTENGLKIALKPSEIIAYEAKCENLTREYDQCKTIYGTAFVDSQCRYALWPLNIQLSSGEYVWVNAIVYIFKNLMGSLKLELPLVNVSTQPLKNYDYSAYLKGVNDQWGFLTPNLCELTIDALRDVYINKLVKETKLTIIAEEGMLNNIILARFDNMPKQIHNIPSEVQEDLYRIIAAPVPDLGCTSCRQEARDFIEKQSWNKYNVKYILSPTGGCLSIVDTAMLDWLTARYMEKNETDGFSNEDCVNVESILIRDLCINSEFSLVIPLLKRMNSSYIYNMKYFKPEAMHEIQTKYNLNLIFISRLQEACYGSVSEQAEVFEKLMPYYLKETISAEKMHAIDCIISDDERQRYDRLQSFLSLGGLIMALVFGLPAIYETVKIIRSFCAFIPYDIPVLTIPNTSVGVWVVLIITLVTHVCRSHKIRRKGDRLF